MPLDYSLLIVEDDEDLLDDYTRWFVRRGYDVTAVHHPRQALEAVTLKDFRVAVVDEGLPEMSGIELMQQLKRLADIQVIMLSGSSEPTVKSQAFECGAFAYLAKPCGLSDLADRVESAIEEFQTPSQSTTKDTSTAD